MTDALTGRLPHKKNTRIKTRMLAIPTEQRLSMDIEKMNLRQLKTADSQRCRKFASTHYLPLHDMSTDLEDMLE